MKLVKYVRYMRFLLNIKLKYFVACNCLNNPSNVLSFGSFLWFLLKSDLKITNVVYFNDFFLHQRFV